MPVTAAPRGFKLNSLPPHRVIRFNNMAYLNMKIKLPAFVLAVLLFVAILPASSSAYVAVSVAIAPPAIPVYQQPYCPGPGYIWTPGYWAYSDFGYYWTPGVWVLAPQIGFLWTPGYWGYRNGGYYFNDGYWGPSIGFYGGINYGYGYYGSGYYGGRWVGNTFSYNTAVSRVNRTVITNTYVNRDVVKSASGSRASFNGPGGVKAKPTAREQAAAKAEHVAPTSAQRSRVEAASKDPALQAKNNRGKPKADAVNTFESKHRPEGAETAAPGKSEQANRQGGESSRTENRAGAEKRADAGRPAGTKKAEGGATKVADGNSAFGHKQGDATTRTTGSQNNAYGKAKSADAHDSRPAAKADRTKKAAATSHARTAVQPSHKAPANKAASAPRASQHAPAAPHRPQVTKTRQATPNGGQVPAAEDGKKKKKKKQGPGG
jgi:hypothetical protein